MSFLPKLCVTSFLSPPYQPPILSSFLLWFFIFTPLSVLADVLCSDRKLLRAFTEQSTPSLLSAAICRQDYLLVHSAVCRQGPVGISRAGRAFPYRKIVHVVCCLQTHISQFSATMYSPSTKYDVWCCSNALGLVSSNVF